MPRSRSYAVSSSAYESHHKVEITDPALVAAAVLSNRYIADRFLPDKAIDLVDEAMAKLRTQIDSKPKELDEVDRLIDQRKIDRASLGKAKDKASRDRLTKVEDELKQLESRQQDLAARWKTQKFGSRVVPELEEELKKLESELRGRRQIRTGSAPANFSTA